MNKIEFSSLAENGLLKPLQLCVDAALSVGFSAPQISFTQAPQSKSTSGCTIYFGERTLRIFPCWQQDDMQQVPDNTDIVLCYGFQTQENRRHVSAPHLISIGIEGSDKCIDTCAGSDSSVMKMAYPKKAVLRDDCRHYSWFVLCLALEFEIEDALLIANAAVSSSGVSRETWPCNYADFKHLSTLETQQCAPFSPVNREDLSLYPVVDSSVWVEKLLSLGIKTVQLRIKDEDSANLEREIERAIELGKTYQAQVFINDYWQLAIKHGAFGVHLGQEDLVKADLAAIQQAGLRLGLSTHGYYEILRAIHFKPSYIALGHIFATTTKQMPSQPQGITKLKLYQQLIGESYPTVAIGGIDINNAEQIWQTGVNSLAVVRAITQADDIQLAIDSFYQVMTSSQADSQPICID